MKEVQFIGSAPGDARRDDAAFSDTAGILPDSVREILAHLRRFEKLEGLRVEFEYDFEDFKEWEDEGVNPGGDVESEEEVRGVEEREAWRALMVRTWEAVLENEKGTVKKLVRVSFSMSRARFPYNFRSQNTRRIADVLFS